MRHNVLNPSDPAGVAADPLFQTYELLEQILLFLDYATLRDARLVNHFWHTVISKNPVLCTAWRQRFRLRELNVLLLGAAEVGKRRLIQQWCYRSNNLVRLPDTDGEIWMAQMGNFDGEGGIEAVKKGHQGFRNRRVDAFVLTYDVGLRRTFDKVERWWQEGKLSVAYEETTDSTAENALAESKSTPRVRHSRVAGWCGTSTIAHALSDQCNTLARETQTNNGSPSTTPGKPVLLALIAMQDETTDPRRGVTPTEGQNLARGMSVPFYEVYTKDAELEFSVDHPLRDFFWTYRKERMKEKAERQRKERVGSEDVKDAEKKGVVETKIEEGHGLWWRRWSRQG